MIVINPRLPAGYTELEYIKSTGTQYIDTGYHPNNQTKFEVRFKSYNVTGTEPVCGGWDDVSNAFLVTIAENSTYLRCGGSNNAVFATQSNIWRVAKCELTRQTLDDDTEETANTSTSTRTTNTFLLFGRNNAGTIQSEGTKDIAYLNIYDGTTLALSMVPAIRNSDSAVGMYDLVSGTFFTNAGTGSFTAGKKVRFIKSIEMLSGIVPKGYMPLEYIESSGTQYIDTGILGTENTSFEIKFQADADVTYPFGVFGSRETASVNNIELCAFESNGFVIDFGDYNDTRMQIPFNTNVNTVYNSKSYRSFNTTSESNAFAGTVSTVENLLLFSVSSTNLVFNNFKGKIFYAKVWESGTLVRDFIPVKRISNNAIGMYDKVSGAFFGNAGTGVFTGGQPKGKPIKTIAIGDDVIWTASSALRSVEQETIDHVFVPSVWTDEDLNDVPEDSIIETGVNYPDQIEMEVAEDEPTEQS